MKEFLEKLKSMLTTARAKANEALSQLPPLEQVEAAGEIAYGIRCMHSSVKYFEETALSFEQSMQSLEAKFTQVVDEAVDVKLQEKLSSNEYMKAADAQESVRLAVEAREREVVERFSTLATRRKELVTGENAMPVEVVDVLSEDVLLADDWAMKVGVVRERFSKLAEKKIVAPAVLVDVAKLSLDDAGNEAFTSRMSLIEAVSISPSKPTVKAPLSQGGGGGGSSKRTIIA